MKIILNGVIPENNFGGPSIMHGAREIIKNVCNNIEIIFYQWGEPVKIAVADMEFETRQIPYTKTSLLLKDAVKLKLGIKPNTKEKRDFFDHIRSSDIVASLLGICFCSNFDKGKYNYIKAIKSAINSFPINFIAKMLGVKSVKCTASYGPIKSKVDVVAAKFSTRHIFDLMYARENESKKQIEQVTGITVSLSPDLANLMPFNISESEKEIIGISVSHQVILQWSSQESYIDCIVDLTKHILGITGYRVFLIPNEITPKNEYHDIHVAQEIHSRLVYDEKVEILDVAKMNSTQLKNCIAECEVVVASRYHSCVAALSAGVPVLVVGWHYKYNELLSWYGQEKWILSSEKCTSNSLKLIFDEFWAVREKNKEIIKEKYPKVREALLEAGKDMFLV